MACQQGEDGVAASSAGQAVWVACHSGVTSCRGKMARTIQLPDEG